MKTRAPILVVLVAVLGPLRAASDQPLVCPDGTGPDCKSKTACGCERAVVGDPVAIHSLNTWYPSEDLNIGTSTGELDFFRTYSSYGAWADSTWGYEAIGGTGTQTIPTPFGRVPGSSTNTMVWTHNYYSFVSVSGADPNAVLVKAPPSGATKKFFNCQNPGRCLPRSSSEGSRLERTSSGYELYDADGERFIFSQYYEDAQPNRLYFLSKVLRPDGQVKAVIRYQRPSFADGGACPASALTPHSGYVREILSPEDAGFRLNYVESAPGVCSIGSVDILGTGEVPRLGATYVYVDGGGYLASADAGELHENYAYRSGLAEIFGRDRGGVRVAQQSMTSNYVGEAFGGGSSFTTAALDLYDACPPPYVGGGCCFKVEGTRTISYRDAGLGDGQSYTSYLSRYTMAGTPDALVLHGEYLLEREDVCSAAPGCDGTVSYYWGRNSSVVALCGKNDPMASGYNPGREMASRGKRGGWHVYPSELLGQNWVVKKESFGHAVPDGSDVGYRGIVYDYDTTPSGEGGNSGIARRIEARRATSNIAGGMLPPKTTYRYFSGTTQVEAVFQAGRTKDVAGVPSDTVYATFFRRAHVCEDTDADELNRIVAIEGPCVPNMAQTGCEAAVSPLMQLTYFPLGTNSTSSGKLQSVSRYPKGCVPGTALTTSYSNYTIEGDPQRIDAPDSVRFNLEYQGRRVKHVERAAQTGFPIRHWYFTWEHDRLTSIKYPENNYERFCYRAGAGSACTGGTWSPLLQWKARSPNADGSAWTEKIAYTWWPDETLKTEQRIDAAGNVRQERSFGADPLRRRTFTRVGFASHSQSYSIPVQFDGNDNLVAVPHAGNSPETFCALNPWKCTQLGYRPDDMLEEMREHPTSLSTALSCFNYTDNGQVNKIRSACAEPSPSLCVHADSACNSMASDYTIDDFGRTVAATLPDDSTAGASVTTEFDARGNVIKRQSRAQAVASPSEWDEFAYDQMSRVLKRSRVWGTGPMDRETLFEFEYDGTLMVPSNCGETPASYAKGRLRRRQDSFGSTWYQYDPDGHVVRETRLRGLATDCNAVGLNDKLHTEYGYTSNGNLSSIRYPHGRLVQYAYGSSGNQDRVAAVSVAFLISGSIVTREVISDVRWEPYGGLKAYVTYHWPNGGGNPSRATVEYLRNENTAPKGTASCAALVRPATEEVHDGTGRVGAVWVSTGDVIGTGSGDLLKKQYRWQGDQLKGEYTCMLGQQDVYLASMVYDAKDRLTGVTGSAAMRGPVGARGYGYDLRGNRTSETLDTYPASSFEYNATTTQADQLLRIVRGTSADAGFERRYSLDGGYDPNGRVQVRANAVDSSGGPSHLLSFSYGGAGSGTGGGDSVFKEVSVNGAVFSYYYDAFNRRRMKVGPLGETHEFFYGLGQQLLEDRAPGWEFPSDPPLDEYVWLGGRPVVILRTRLKDPTGPNAWQRTDDLTGNCPKLGEAAICGPHFVVTDYLGKPVLTVNTNRKVSGLGEYDPFGRLNQKTQLEAIKIYDSALNGAGTWQVAQLSQAVPTGAAVDVRARFHFVDTEACTVCIFGNCSRQCNDYAYVGDGAMAALSNQVCDYHVGPAATTWATMPSSGSAYVWFYKDGNGSRPPGYYCGGGIVPQHAYAGVALESFEYRKRDPAATWFFTPLRFPGQYFDDETGLHENWNRFYDNDSGDYLQPEPLLRTPYAQIAYAHAGYSLPVYGYALNNPISFYDPDGLGPTGPSLSTVYMRMWIMIASGRLRDAIEYYELEMGRSAPRWLGALNAAFSSSSQVMGQCTATARTIHAGFTQLGKKPEMVQVFSTEGQFLSWQGKTMVSDNNFHAAVRMGDMIYDAYTGSAGMTTAAYVQAMQHLGTLQIISAPGLLP